MPARNATSRVVNNALSVLVQRPLDHRERVSEIRGHGQQQIEAPSGRPFEALRAPQ
jgi:hypothetical protein